MPALGEKTWYLRQFDLFRGLTDEEVEEIGPMMEPRTFRPGELVIGPTTPPQRVYVVKEGTIRLFHEGPDGRQIAAGTVTRGALLGVSTLFQPAQDGFLMAEAVTDVLVCVGDGWTFLRSIARWPQVMLSLALQLGARLVETEQQLGRASGADARTRLAHLLYQLARDSGEVVPGGRQIRGALTHVTLARQIAASRETVTRMLAVFEAERRIRRVGRKIVVTDLERLVEIAGLGG